VDGLSLSAERGAVTAVLGPNGAGKTSTVEICEGYRRPDAGTVSVLGLDPVADARRLRPRVGVMLQSGGIPPAVRPGEYLRAMARFHAHPLDPAPLTRESKIVVFNSVLSLGNAAMMTGDSAQVWRCLNAAAPYAMDSRSQIRLANARGAAYLDRKDAADARAAFTRALRIADEAGLPATYEHRGAAQFGLVNALLLSGKVAQ